MKHKKLFLFSIAMLASVEVALFTVDIDWYKMKHWGIAALRGEAISAYKYMKKIENEKPYSITETDLNRAKESNPLVSVLLPVYNAEKEKFLDISIPSVLNQTYTNFELLLLDDGSKDNSYKIMEEYAKKDPRIKIFKNDKNMGISYSRNKLNSLANGKYLMIMDQDDRNHPDRMLRQVAYLEKYNFADVISLVNNYTNNDIIKFSLFYNKIPINHPTLMIKRDFIINNKIKYDTTYKCGNDHILANQMRDKGAHFILTEEKLLFYSGHHFSKSDNKGVSLCDIDYTNFSKKQLQKYPKIELIDQMSQTEFVCHFSNEFLKTKEFSHLFTPGFLEYTKIQSCTKLDINNMLKKVLK